MALANQTTDYRIRVHSHPFVVFFIKGVPMIQDALKTLRSYNTLKQSELAKKLEISPSFLCEIEVGRKLPNLKLLKKYAEIFEISISDIFYLQDIIDNNLNALNGKIFKIIEWLDEKKGTVHEDINH